MLKLEPIIARFVDDVLDAVRSASLADVDEALSPGGASPRSAGSGRSARPGGRGKRRPELPPVPRDLLQASLPDHDAPSVGDITDPAALLEAAVAAYGAPAAYEWLLTAGADDTEPPASTVRPVDAARGAHAHGAHHVTPAAASRARSRA